VLLAPISPRIAKIMAGSAPCSNSAVCKARVLRRLATASLA
jgi:hypothetical protein